MPIGGIRQSSVAPANSYPRPLASRYDRMKFLIIYVTKQMCDATDSADRPATQDDALVRRVARALAEWEDSGTLYTEFAKELVALILRDSPEPKPDEQRKIPV